MRFVDANVILRYLLDDDPQLAEKAAKILEQGHKESANENSDKI